MGLRKCISASVRQAARQFGMAASTVRAIDLRYLQRWSATRRKDRLEQMGVDEIYFGKQMKFITVISNSRDRRAAVVRTGPQARNPR